MAFLDEVKKVMDEARRTGNGYMMMNELAAKLGIKAEPPKRGTGPGKLPGEVLEDKLMNLQGSSKELGFDFPWEIITYRSRETGGIPDMPGIIYRTVQLLGKDGKPKQTKKGTDAEQRFYWPALAWVNPAKVSGQKAISELAQVLSPQIPADRFHIVSDGLTLTITYIVPPLAESAGSTGKTPLAAVA